MIPDSYTYYSRRAAEYRRRASLEGPSSPKEKIAAAYDVLARRYRLKRRLVVKPVAYQPTSAELR